MLPRAANGATGLNPRQVEGERLGENATLASPGVRWFNWPPQDFSHDRKIAIPAPDDLIELRGAGRERVDRTVETFGGFTLVKQSRVTTVADLDASAVHDVLHSIYRPMQARPAEAGRVTFSLDVLVFAKS